MVMSFGSIRRCLKRLTTSDFSFKYELFFHSLLPSLLFEGERWHSSSLAIVLLDPSSSTCPVGNDHVAHVMSRTFRAEDASREGQSSRVNERSLRANEQ